MAQTYDIAVIGGGIVGLSTAMHLTRQYSIRLVLLEAESKLAAHQTGNNSGVIHSGIYYKPGSLKAKNCIEGRDAMYAFCQEQGVLVENCGKLIIATNEAEIPALERLFERGQQNGIQGLKRLTPAELRDYEPYAAGVAAVHVPQTGIVDYIGVCHAYARLIESFGGEIRLSTRVTSCQADGEDYILETNQGPIRTKNLINCAGLQSDRVARLCGVDPQLQILPFRGEYYEVIPAKHYLVKNLIYPVPDPRFPFLGVHFTRMVKGGIEAGPNAVLAFKREGYKMGDISLRDISAYFFSAGFWAMGFKYWRMAIGEYYRSISKNAFVRALQKLMPEIQPDDVHRAGAGVRAQALDAKGNLLDDFAIREVSHQIHVLNAPSPAATASISIGNTIARMAEKNFGLGD